ncbi:hypothetical protein B566_EDAN013046 [Ephemera danica]|nr:hypothetical protein B566_EDAN013046 [Ephemera danica]
MENEGDWRNPCVRVIGDSLESFVGRSVRLLGEVVHTNGCSLTLKTTDNKVVNVQLPRDNMEMYQGLIELRGTVVGSDALECDEIVKFETDPQDFDTELLAHSSLPALFSSRPLLASAKPLLATKGPLQAVSWADIAGNSVSTG